MQKENRDYNVQSARTECKSHRFVDAWTNLRVLKQLEWGESIIKGNQNKLLQKQQHGRGEKRPNNKVNDGAITSEQIFNLTIRWHSIQELV